MKKLLVVALCAIFAIGTPVELSAILGILPKVDSDKKYGQLIDQVIKAGASLLGDNKQARDFKTWDAAVDAVKVYADENNKALGQAGFFAVLEERNNGLRDLYKSSKISDIKSLESLMESLIKEREKLTKEAARIRSSALEKKESRYAAEALNTLFGMIQMAAEDLRQDLLAQKAKSGPVNPYDQFAQNAGKVAEQFQAQNNKLDALIKRLKKGDIAGKLSADDEYASLLKEVQVLRGAADANFKAVLNKLNAFAQKNNKSASTWWSTLTPTAQDAPKSAQYARSEAAKIESSLFASRTGRYPYLLYAAILDVIAGKK